MSAAGRLAGWPPGWRRSWLLASCSVVEQGTGVLADAGKISESDRQAIVKTSTAVRSTFGEITEEEEYYIGRGVAALVLAQYPVYHNDALTRYINELGQSAAVFSDRPETYAGYHFPSSTRTRSTPWPRPAGSSSSPRACMRRCAERGDAGRDPGPRGRATSAPSTGSSPSRNRGSSTPSRSSGQRPADRYGPEELAELTAIFEGALGDVVGHAGRSAATTGNSNTRPTSWP